MNLLITRHDKIGDFVVTLPLFKAIKTQYPKIKIFALVSKVNYDFANCFDFIDDVILYDKDDFKGTLSRIKKANIDISISGFINIQLGWLLFLSGIKKRIAPATKLAQLFFNKRITQRRSRVEKKEFEYNLDLAKALDKDISLTFEKPVLFCSENEIINEFKKKYCIDSSKKIVGFHPGYGGSSDGNLILEDYVRLAKKVNDKNLQVVFTFGPDDLGVKKLLENLVDFDAIFYESKGAIIDFCKLLSGFKLFVSTSTGPMHLAGAVNIKTLSFFGDSLFASSKRWATISEEKNQHNFMINENYTQEDFLLIEKCLEEVLF